MGEDDEPEHCAGNGQHAENGGEQRGLLCDECGSPGGDEANGAEDFERADGLDGSILRVEAPGPSRDGSKAANPEYYL